MSVHTRQATDALRPGNRLRPEVKQLRARGIRKSYFKGSRPAGIPGRLRRVVRAEAIWARHGRMIEVPVLLGVDLELEAGQFVSIMGSSGSGKSTLLHVLGTLDAPDAGEIELDGGRIDNLEASARDRVRNDVFGFIFQFYHLLPELTTLENVLLPLMIRHGVSSYWQRQKQLRCRAEALLDRVGLGQRQRHKPSELSGGEMQRAAIARAVSGGPQILLADEPTGNLDQATGRQIFDLLVSLNRLEGLTIIMVTHDITLARRADRCLELVDGKLRPLGA